MSSEPSFAIEQNERQHDHMHLMVLASLFECDISIDWLVELTGYKASYVLASLEKEVHQKRLIRRDHGIYAFQDDEIFRKLRNDIPFENKRELHNKIANFLLRDLPANDKKDCVVSRHLLHIDNDEEGCHCLIKAGDINLNNYQTEQAFQCYFKALQDLSTLSGENVDWLFSETAIKYSKVSTARQDTAQVIETLQDAKSRSKKRGHKHFQSLLEMHIAKNEWLRSRYSLALNHFDKGWAMAKKLENPSLMRSATVFSTFFLYWQGRFKEAVQSYESSVPDVEKHPEHRFPLLGAITVGYCYAQIGQVTQGLGMLDAIRANCLEKGDLYLASQTAGNIGGIMLDIRRVDDAIPYLELSFKEAVESHNGWVRMSLHLMLSFAFYLKGSKKLCIKHLRDFLEQSRQVKTTVYLYSYLMALSWAMKQKKLPQVEDLYIEKEVHRAIRSKNLFIKGIGYRFQALLQQQEQMPESKVIYSLNKSLKYLSEAGHQIALFRSRLELARVYVGMDEIEKARKLIKKASGELTSFNEDMIPDDLRFLIEAPPVNEYLLKEILKLGQEVVTIQNNKDLVRHIITTVNRLTGAERGAIFLFDEDEDPPKMRLRASKNLTSDQINHPNFAFSLRIIEEVAHSGKGCIRGIDPDDESIFFSNEVIRSLICVPMILRDEIVGVLYHDNRLLSSAFKESDLELLYYFAALAAVALDNSRAYKEISRLNKKLSQEKQYYEEEHRQSLHFDNIVGKSDQIQHVLTQTEQVADTESTVLILGETGVGKELVARAIHSHSSRKDKPFIKVHCSALPENLIPSELFGHEKGAFTGATSRRIGRFELADGGTIFLDEIGEIPADVQIRLLRVLQTKEFERVGGSKTLYSDFRLIAATHRDLALEVRANRFRPDLYYRLNVFPIFVPPLRERNEDIPLLAYHFLNIHSTRMQKEFNGIPEHEIDKLLQYDWPGNVRELENVIEHGTILSSGPEFHIPEFNIDPYGKKEVSKKNSSLMENEKRHILWALKKTGWKVRGAKGAAELLEIHPSTLAFRMKKLGIKRPGKAS